MILVLIITGLFGVIGFLFGYMLDAEYPQADRLRTGIGFGLTMLVIGVIIGFIAAAMNPGKEVPIERRTNIVLMSDGTSTEGRFSLFNGYIDTVEAYRYYYRQGDGGLKFASIPAHQSVIYEDSESPYFISYCHKYVKSWYSINPLTSVECDRFSFHVPKNSVAPGVNLDGE